MRALQEAVNADLRRYPDPEGGTSFGADGFALVQGVMSASDCDAIAPRLAMAAAGSAGTRCLLPFAWCRALAERLRGDPKLAAFIPADYVAAQCTYFEKSISRNWLVAMHQDLSIPVAARVDDAGLRGWSQKEGSLFVQPPVEVLERLLAVRVHLEACTLGDGPLQVVPGSHLHARIAPEAAARARRTGPVVACTAERGDALLMRPLLLHASSKATGTSLRRVLHFLFGPRDLPLGLRWQHAV